MVRLFVCFLCAVGENVVGADSGSSSAGSSSSNSDHDGEVEQPEVHKEQGAEQDQPARDHQIERTSIQAELADSSRQVHSRVRWYGNHEHEYNDLEETAKKANLPFKRYQRQTRTRWSSQVNELAIDLFNNAAQPKQHQVSVGQIKMVVRSLLLDKRPRRYPERGLPTPERVGGHTILSNFLFI
jgi:hypothetical protein